MRVNGSIRWSNLNPISNIYYAKHVYKGENW